MLSREDNDRLTRVGPGTPMGTLMRRYWIPALFADQLAKPDSPPVRVKLLGEELVAFRDSEGVVGLIQERCPHRTASLFFGRNEKCGLRCVYHGWKFDRHGNCVDQPSEPPGHDFKHKVKITAYPTAERGGVVWTYMGPAELMPEFPALEWAELPAAHVYATRHIQECNWLQGLEGGFDPAHLAFLHVGTAGGDTPVVPSQQKVIPKDFGFVAATGRDLPGGETRWTVTEMLMPFHKVFSTALRAAHAWVPIDDDNTMLYSIEYLPDRPLEEKDMERIRAHTSIHTENHPGTDWAIHNRANDYLVDRELQASGKSFTGMRGLGIQDCAIQESMGPVADRTVEHLGVSDTTVIRIRQLLLKTLDDLEAGRPLPGTRGEAYRVRSCRLSLPTGQPVEAVVDDAIRYGRLAAAE